MWPALPLNNFPLMQAAPRSADADTYLDGNDGGHGAMASGLWAGFSAGGGARLGR